MRSPRASAATVVLLVLIAGVSFAAESAPAKSTAPAGQQVAIFSIPKLMEGTLPVDLAKALADKPGILSAKVDKTKATFNVTFDAKKTNPDEILGAVTAVAKEATLDAIVPASAKAAAGPDCGKCPRAKSCSGAEKK